MSIHDVCKQEKTATNVTVFSWYTRQDYRLKPPSFAHSDKSKLFQNFTALRDPMASVSKLPHHRTKANRKP